MGFKKKGGGKKKQKAPMEIVFMFLGDVADDEKNPTFLPGPARKRYKMNKWVKKHCGGGDGGSDPCTGGDGGNHPGTGGACTGIAA
ncbi:hypothetical protein F2Q69_00061442 [Brassica cretica]|uniref:Uncharacterized protein n=1 Tax=Brassica cretica TaxID=69181 RepID=A0A8S9REL0_BRACR|nr:hypothetical protein F2Q69_00061442 [Brassica cretica]